MNDDERDPEREPLLESWKPALLPPEEFAKSRAALEHWTPETCCDPNNAIWLHGFACALLNHLDALDAKEPKP